MERTDIIDSETFQWLRFVLDPSRPMPDVQDWRGLLNFAKQQAVVGICSPTRFEDSQLEQRVLVEWFGIVRMVSARNRRLNEQVVLLVEKLKASGLHCCILKGQGNATMYPNPDLRMPGDIDVWVDADKEVLLEYVKHLYPNEEETFKHIKFPVFKDTPVDLHYTPLRFSHPGHNKRLQRWIAENKDGQMTHFVKLPQIDMDIAIPTAAFNAVYQLGHILIHIADEGIGLRQFVDYYYVLKKLGSAEPKQRDAIRDTWKRLGMMRLARAVMWIERQVLGLPKEYALVVPDEKRGDLLLEVILEGGNFGKYSSRWSYDKYGRFVQKVVKVWHLVKVSSCFPGEAFSRMMKKVWMASKMLVGG